MPGDPRSALAQLRRESADGRLAAFCADARIELLVAFGSAVTSADKVTPRDLDLAVVLADGTDLLAGTNSLVQHLALDRVDVMDLHRAGTVARAQALCDGELLYEQTVGMFAEMQILAMVQRADTRWLRELQLEALAR